MDLSVWTGEMLVIVVMGGKKLIRKEDGEHGNEGKSFVDFRVFQTGLKVETDGKSMNQCDMM